MKMMCRIAPEDYTVLILINTSIIKEDGRVLSFKQPFKMQPYTNNKSLLTKAIVLALIIAGTLDMLSAIVIYNLIMHRVTTLQILDGIAAALFGKTIIGNQIVMAIIGLILHYFITFCFVVFYFLLYPRIPLLQKNKIISGLLYGILVWCIMNLLVVPVATDKHYHFLFLAFLRQILPLIFCIGLPISLISSNYYTQKQVAKT